MQQLEGLWLAFGLLQELLRKAVFVLLSPLKFLVQLHKHVLEVYQLEVDLIHCVLVLEEIVLVLLLLL